MFRTVSIFRDEEATLNMEIVHFSETIESTDQSARRQNPEDHHRYRLENFKFYLNILISTKKLAEVAIIHLCTKFILCNKHFYKEAK